MSCGRLALHTFVPALVALSLIILFDRPAYAYIDAGTGSYVLQVVIASILAGAFVIKSMWSNIVKVFKRGGKSGDDDN